MRFIRHNEPFVNIVASATAILNSSLVLGNVIEREYLTIGGGNTQANMTGIRVKLNGKVTVGSVTGTQLGLINQYRLNNNPAGMLTVDFAEPDAKSMQGEMMGSIDTVAAGVTSFVIECDLAAGVAPTLDSFSQLRDQASLSANAGFNANLSPLVKALIPSPWAPTNAVEAQQTVNAGSGGNSLFKRLHVINGTATLTTLRIKRNSLDIYEAITPAFSAQFQPDYGRAAPAGIWTWDTLMDGNQSDAQPTRNADSSLANYQFLVTPNGAGTLFAFADVYSLLGAL